MTIKFTNGKTMPYIEAFENEEYFNGTNRRVLTVHCEKNAISVDELNTILSNEKNTTEITLINEDMDISNVYSGYALKLKVGMEQYFVSGETPEVPAVYEDRIVFKLGKRTYIEEQLKRLGL